MKKIVLFVLALAFFAGPRLATAASYSCVLATSTSTLKLFPSNAAVTGVTYTPSTVVQPGIQILKMIVSNASASSSAFTLWDLPASNPVTYSAKAKSLGVFYIPTTRIGEVADYSVMQGVGNSTGIPVTGYLGVVDASGASTCTVQVLYNRIGTNPAAAPSY